MNASHVLPTQLKNLTPIHLRYYLDCLHRFILVCAGRRSRKTLIGMRRVLTKAIRNPNHRYFLGAPTHQQAKEIFWERLKKDCFEFKSFVNETDLRVKLINGTELQVVGLDRPERIEGRTPSWNGCMITEFPNLKAGAWEAHIRPTLSDENGWAILDGVPDIVSAWHRKMVRQICNNSIPIPVPMQGAFAEFIDDPQWCFYTWLSSDVLTPEEIEAAKRTLDPQTYAQEYEGSLINPSGLVYYAYSADYFKAGNLDKKAEYDRNLPVYVGMDFNVSPMSAILCHFRKSEQQGSENIDEVIAFKEYFLKNSNTRTVAERIVTDYPESKRFILTPCQSSSARQSVAEIGITDVRIIQDVFHRAGRYLEISKRTKNPLIRNRVNATNSKLTSATNKHFLRVNPSCRELIADWESLAYKEGTSDIDLSDPMRGHISAAMDYLLERHFPVFKPDSEIMEMEGTVL
jgi:hypothetical protein